MRLIDERDGQIIAPDPTRAPPEVNRAWVGPSRRVHHEALRLRLWAWLRAGVSDEWVIALLAGGLSIGFFVWYETHGLTTAFNDARSRELIARRVLMGRTPGLAQLGTVWPPLLSMLMLPLIWNDTLFRDGLAGSLPSMLAYVVAAVYIYRTARLITSSRAAGWVAAAVLMLNPSLLYMQSTPMSETGALAALVVAIFYGLRAARTLHAADIVRCAAAVAAGTLIRYDDWLLAFALLPVLAYVAWQRRDRALAEGWAILYGLLGFAGCGAWVIYNWVIFHDPLLAFFYGQSSHTFFAGASAAELPARGHPVLALETYGLSVAETVGWVIVPIAVLGLLVFVWRARLRPAMLAAYLTLIPFAFYWLVIYKGVNTESLPQLGEGAYYNIRFGLAMIPAVALFAAVLTTVGPQLLRRALVGTSLVAVTIAGVTGLILSTPFVLREAVAGYGGDTRRSGQSEAEWLSSQYRGGDVLYTYGGEAYVMFYLLTEHKFADGSFITAANGAQFARAEAHPERWVTWIITNVETGKPQEPQDPLWKSFYDRSDWRRYFVLRRRFTTHVLPRGGAYGTTEFYERIGPSKGPPLGLQERSDIASYRLRAELRGELGSHGGSNGPAIPASDARTWSGWKQQGREANEALRKLREEVLLCGRTADPLGALGVSSFVWPVAVRC